MILSKLLFVIFYLHFYIEKLNYNSIILINFNIGLFSKKKLMTNFSDKNKRKKIHFIIFVTLKDGKKS